MRWSLPRTERTRSSSRTREEASQPLREDKRMPRLTVFNSISGVASTGVLRLIRFIFARHVARRRQIEARFDDVLLLCHLRDVFDYRGDLMARGIDMNRQVRALGELPSSLMLRLDSRAPPPGGRRGLL